MYLKIWPIPTALLFLMSQAAISQELYEPFPAIRALGMGNAFTAVANDESAVWTNPAGVARARKHRKRKFFHAKVPNLGIGVNNKTKTLYQSVTGDSEAEIADIISENEDLDSDKPYYTNVHMFPVALFDYDRQMPGAIGIFNNSTSNILIEKEVPEQARTTIISDTGGLLNFVWTNRVNRISAGIQARYVTRYAYEDTIPTGELDDRTAIQERLQDGANQTTGIGIDAGAIYTFADYWFPTVGFSVLNIPTGCQDDYLNPHSQTRGTVCGTKYTGTIDNEDALSNIDPTDFRIGLSIAPRLTREVTLRLALDVHHLWLEQGDQTIGLSGLEAQKMIHAGAELFLGNPLDHSPLSVRVGLNQGYYTAGFSVQVPYFSIDFATYGVDVASGTKQTEDRRMLAGISMVF